MVLAPANQVVLEAAGEETREVAVQCCPEDMLEPFARTPLGKKSFAHLLTKGNRYFSWCKAPYQADSHFHRFEEPDVVVRLAAALQGADLVHLADLFLGSGIGGVLVKRHIRRPDRRVPDRHVVEAVLLCENMPGFRVALVSCSARLLMGGVQERKAPLDGRSLVAMAKEDPDMWARLAYTALDFAGRLISAGALPGAFAVELLRLGGEVGMTTDVLSKVMCPWSVHCWGQVAGSQPPSPARPHDDELPMARTQSQTHHGGRGRGRGRGCCERGTLLRPFDECQPYLSVSVAYVDRAKTAHTVINSAIPACDLADYWRSSAGGEHGPEKLEALAMEAEEEFRAQEKLREQEEQEAGGAALATLARKSPALKDSWTATLTCERPRTQATSEVARPSARGVESRRQVSCCGMFAWILGP